jgi:NAD(P)-dependent dehydrogenase (short-subunit alcohol dehydrogenase family)
MTPLKDRVYIVTGGTRGLGKAIARSLTDRGARVGLVGRDAAQLRQTAEELGSELALPLCLDITQCQQLPQGFARIKAHFGRLDGLVNNAGLARPGHIVDMDESEVDLQLSTNIKATVFCCQAVVPLLDGSDNPRIVNISSASAWHQDEMAHLSIYAATKAAVERFSRDLRGELQDRGIGVTVLRPGAAATDFAGGWEMERFRSALLAWQKRGTHMDTGMEPHHVGEAAAWCLACPPGVSVDLLEIRPNRPVPKVTF